MALILLLSMMRLASTLAGQENQSIVIDSVTALIWTISLIGLLFSGLVSTAWFAIKKQLERIDEKLMDRKEDDLTLKNEMTGCRDSLEKRIDENMKRSEEYDRETRKSAYHAHDRITEAEKNFNNKLTEHIKEMHIKNRPEG